MRCTRNVPVAIETAALILVLVLAGIADAQARRPSARRRTTPEAKAPPTPTSAASLRMQETTLTGERQAPDMIFVVPTGKGGKLSSPHLRDYSGEIQEPVVKSWLEKEEIIGPMAAQTSPSQRFDWKAALKAEPRRPAPPLPDTAGRRRSRRSSSAG